MTRLQVRIDDRSGWELSRSRSGVGGARRGASAVARLDDVVPPRFLAPGVSVAAVEDASPRARRGPTGAAEAIDLEVVCDPGTHAMLLARHPSGALSFHAPLAETRARRRGGDRTGPSIRFRVEVGEPPPSAARRGLLSRTIKLAVLRITDAVIARVVSEGVRLASRRAEEAWWKSQKRAEGWYRIKRSTRGRPVLHRVQGIEPGGPALLFLHGTFSHTIGSFDDLLASPQFSELEDRYGQRIFAFDHYTVSRSLEENARDLLAGLPGSGVDFDVVSYSRGGVLLRTLAERSEHLGELGRRFRLGRGVLLAVPNAGTPLATGQRWEDTFGLVANLLEIVPANPWTTGAEFIADGIVWLASRVTMDLPGIAAMDAEGDVIAALQEGNGAPAGEYSALGANYHPDAALWRRLLDLGVDSFFAGANDLVVPTDGAWRIDPGAVGGSPISVGRVGCFGFDGNIEPSLGAVNHLNLTGQPETARFVANALAGEQQGLTALDLARPRRSRKAWRSDGAAKPAQASAKSAATVPRAGHVPRVGDPEETVGAPTLVSTPSVRDRTLHLMVLAGSPARATGRAQSIQSKKQQRTVAQILGIYGNARVVEPFYVSGAEAPEVGERFEKIIARHERIGMTLDGRARKTDGQVPPLPNDDELRSFGTLLFEALFVGKIRRLYDLARSEQSGEALNLIFTCEIPWLAAKPWEFAFDPVRRKFLATEEIHFIRNVFTSVPADQTLDRRSRLRLLIVEAQPSGTQPLALAEEEARIRHQFRQLLDTGLIDIDLLAQATPETLHERVFGSSLERRPYDIVHFMGHGEFDREANAGRLLFTSDDGGAQSVDVQTLREILCGRGVQLIFLNACDTARDSRKTANRGVAQALMEAGAPAVVANQYKVLDPSAICFAKHLYWALAQGASIAEAAREARIAVNYSVDGELIDWAVPVVYARDPDYRICKRADRVQPKTRAANEPRRRARRGPAGGEVSIVGLADLARYFPALPGIVARLNEVQDRFEFREVTVAVPLGVWERDKKTGKTYLHPERFADRMTEKIRSLGVGYLACLTQWWMRDESNAEIHAWWSGRRDLPVVVFSTAGLALPAQGAEGGRVVANALAQGLAAQLLVAAAAGSRALHLRKPSDCPLHRNRTDASGGMSGRLRFDRQCRKRLTDNLSEATVAALDALLGAYDSQLGD